MSVFEFEGHTLDLKQGRLRNGANDVTLRPKSLALLTYFVTNPGRVISKDELIAAVWPNVVVSDDSLSQCLKDIRGTLGPGAEGLIRTVPRRGYLLDEAKLSVCADDRGAVQPARTAHKPSLAVLPFTNMSGDPEQEFFADGMTADLITDLSKASGLSVIARNSVFTYKGRAVDISDVATRFGVSHIVEGSVRKSGQRVRINAQLVAAQGGTPVWAERYDRDLSDIFSVQDDITHSIVDALKVHLLAQESEAIRKISTTSSAAYEFYLRGRHYLSLYSLKAYDAAHRLFIKAIELDPGYARAYAGASDCCAFRCMWNADVSIEKALELSAQATDLDPQLPEAHAARGWALAVAARYQEAIGSFKRAIALDPMSFEAHHLCGHTFALQGRYADAVRHFERAIAIAPDDFQPYGLLSHQYWALGRQADSVAMERLCLDRVERELELRPDNQRALCFGAFSLAILGDGARAREWAERALWLDADDTQVLYNVASVCALLGDQARALELLERCLPGKHPQMLVWVRHDRDFAALHDNPRFLALVGPSK
ncbi:tetratricopeptide repeat protein [Mesorhizobium sp. KR1-2]|uniref:TPR end-of-group domain-containing protein n=1 Tax=Mesorhizobium sp. KR1-2 TaxID=3156609 RepID=UPI0032B60632